MEMTYKLQAAHMLQAYGLATALEMARRFAREDRRGPYRDFWPRVIACLQDMPATASRTPVQAS